MAVFSLDNRLKELYGKCYTQTKLALISITIEQHDHFSYPIERTHDSGILRDMHDGAVISELDEVVSARIRAVGDSYGRRTLHGLLHSEGIHVSQRRIAAHTHRHELASRTQSMAQHINPVPYVAHCFGDKLHVDQNEKLNIVAVDGYSRKVVAFVALPNKNPFYIQNTI